LPDDVSHCTLVPVQEVCRVSASAFQFLSLSGLWAAIPYPRPPRPRAASLPSLRDAQRSPLAELRMVRPASRIASPIIRKLRLNCRSERGTGFENGQGRTRWSEVSQYMGESEVYLTLVMAFGRTDFFPGRGHLKPRRV
jgi:hypothetical protein